MRFSQDFIEKVRDANNIVEIIGQYTELKGSGHRFMGRCPFPDHSDKSPSFSVTEDRQFFFCFGCKKGGNVFQFLELFNGISFPEAVEFLARRAAIPLPEPSEAARVRVGALHEDKDRLLKVNKLAAVFYYQQLKRQPAESVAKKYLQSRGLSDEVVEVFRLGLSPDGWQELASHLESKQVPLALAETLDLLRVKKSAANVTKKGVDSYIDRYRSRLMFPIFSSTADVIGFGGRTMADEQPKYLNSSDSPVFNKSRVLYGIHETGKHIRAQDEAIVVEGYMDAISLYAAGVKNVVAILGTAFTAEHAKFLKRYTLNIKVLLDGDEAGISGAERSLPLLLEAGLMAKGLLLPEKMDPDDFVKRNGAAALREELARAPELFTLLLTRRWMNDYHATASDKVRVVEEASHALRGMRNAQLFDLYAIELARHLDVEVAWVRKALQPLASATRDTRAPRPRSETAKIAANDAVAASDIGLESAQKQAPEAASDTIKMIILKGAPKEEIMLLSLVLAHETLMRDLLDAGIDSVTEIISHQGVRDALTFASEHYRVHAGDFVSLTSTLASLVDQPGLLAAALSLNIDENSSVNERKVIGDYIAAIRARHLANRTRELAKQLKGKPTPEVLAEFMELSRDRLSGERFSLEDDK